MISVAVKHMLAAGMDPDAIVKAVEEMEREMLARLENGKDEGRSTAAIRQARYRDRKRNETVTSVTGDVTRNATPAPSSFPLDPPPTTPPYNPPIITPAPKTKQARGTRLPADWWPAAEDEAFAIKAGFNGDALQSLTDQFRDYWHAAAGAKGVKLDWSATWRNWVRNTNRPRSQAPPRVPHHVANSIAVMKSIEAEFGVSHERADNNVIDLDARDFAAG